MPDPPTTAAARRPPSAAIQVPPPMTSARSRNRNCGSDQRARSRDNRTWGTSLGDARTSVVRTSPGRNGWRRDRGEREQLQLDLGAQTIGVGFLRIGRLYQFEGDQRVLEVAVSRLRTGAGQGQLAATRQFKTRVAERCCHPGWRALERKRRRPI